MSDDVVAGFLARCRASYVFARVAAETANFAALAALVLVCAWLGLPRALPALAVAALPALGLFAALRAVALRLDVAGLDERLGLEGWLRTHASGVGDPAARAWLADGLAARLRALPPERELGRRLARASRRPLRLVLVLAALLLLLRGLWLPALPEGVLPLAGRAAARGASGGTGTGETRAGTQTEPAASAAEPSEAASNAGGAVTDSATEAGHGEEQPADRKSAAAPEPTLGPLDAALVDSFLVPRFEQPAAADPAADPAAGDAGSAGRAPEASASPAAPAPPSAAMDFTRAAERALRSRHVPESEREVVRRWFAAGAARR